MPFLAIHLDSSGCPASCPIDCPANFMPCPGASYGNGCPLPHTCVPMSGNFKWLKDVKPPAQISLQCL